MPPRGRYAEPAAGPGDGRRSHLDANGAHRGHRKKKLHIMLSPEDASSTGSWTRSISMQSGQSTSSKASLSTMSASSADSTDGAAAGTPKKEPSSAMSVASSLGVAGLHTGPPSRAPSAVSSVASGRSGSHRSVRSSDRGELMQLTDPQVAKVREKFDEFDVDGSGTIEKAEFLMAMRALRLPCADKVEEDTLFSKVDRDGDGTVDFPEFLQLITQKIGIRMVRGIMLDLHRAEGMVPTKDHKGASDPLAIVSIGKYSTFTTQPQKKTYNPNFEDSQFMVCPENCTKKLVIRLFGNGKVFRLDGRLSREYLGGAEYDISGLTKEPKLICLEMTREIEIDDDGNEVPKGDLVKTSSSKVRKNGGGDQWRGSAGIGRPTGKPLPAVAVTTGKRAKNLTLPSKNPPVKSAIAGRKRSTAQKNQLRGTPPRRANDGADVDAGSKTSGQKKKIELQVGRLESAPVEPRMKQGHRKTDGHKSGQWKLVSTSLHEIAQVEAAQVQPTVEAYGKIYFTIRRATDTRRPEEGRQNQNPEWSDGEGEDGPRGGGGSAGLADLETILRDVVGKPELSPEEKDAHAAGTWAELDPDGIGVVAVHKLAWLIRQTWPELHRDDLYVKCFRTVVAKMEQKDRQSVTADRRTWVERKYFVKLLCTIFYFRKLLDMYEARSGPAASRDKAMLVELREFQYMMKRLGIKASDAEIKGWFNAGHTSDVGTVRLEELAYGLALRRFFPEEETATAHSQYELSKAAKAKAKRAMNAANKSDSKRDRRGSRNVNGVDEGAGNPRAKVLSKTRDRRMMKGPKHGRPL